MSIDPAPSLVLNTESYSESTSDPGNNGCGLLYSKQGSTASWIIDSGASDHMTFDPRDLRERCPPKRSRIANANGVIYPVTGAGRADPSPYFSLPNTLLVPSLTNKLLSVGQATEDLNCCVLMYPNFCLFQDILTKKIIGCGTKRRGLYYMDDCSMGLVNTAKEMSLNEHQI